MHELFDLGVFPVVTMIFIFTFGFACIFHYLTEHSPVAAQLHRYRTVPDTTISAVALLFGLFAAFLGADVWDRIRQERQSIEQEIGAVRTINAVAQGLGDVGDGIRTDLRTFVVHNTALHSPPAEDALDELVVSILKLADPQSTHQPSRDAMLAAYHDIKSARALRVLLRNLNGDPHKWATVILLGLITQFSFTFAAGKSSKGQAAGLAIFTLAYAVTLTAIAIHEMPRVLAEDVHYQALSRDLGPNS